MFLTVSTSCSSPCELMFLTSQSISHIPSLFLIYDSVSCSSPHVPYVSCLYFQHMFITSYSPIFPTHVHHLEFLTRCLTTHIPSLIFITSVSFSSHYNPLYTSPHTLHSPYITFLIFFTYSSHFSHVHLMFLAYSSHIPYFMFTLCTSYHIHLIILTCTPHVPHIIFTSCS